MRSSSIFICRSCFYNNFISTCRCYFKCSFGFYFCIVFVSTFNINSGCTNFCTVNYIINYIVFISLKSLSINYNIEIWNNNSTCIFVRCLFQLDIRIFKNWLRNSDIYNFFSVFCIICIFNCNFSLYKVISRCCFCKVCNFFCSFSITIVEFIIYAIITIC